MILEQLHLQGFRRFDDATVTFERDLTVIVGVNGAGKSSVLECVATLVEPWIPFFLEGERRDPVTLSMSDVRVGSSEATSTLRLSRPARDLLAQYPNTSAKVLRSIEPGMSTVVKRWPGDKSLPTLYAFLYAVDRTLSGDEPVADPGAVARRTVSPAEEFERDVRSALSDALSPRRTRFEPFLAWFREREDLENEERIRQRSFDHEDRQLACVRRAIQGMLPGFSAPTVHRATRSLVVTKDGVELALNQLSDGERCLFAMVGDLARRLAQLDPWSDDPLRGEVVVLIDEIELHLHPGWQRAITHALRRVFPNAQLVLTTHSPQVIGEVPTRCIRLLRDGKIEPAPAPTDGRDSNRILDVLMGAESRSEDVAAMFAQLAGAEDEERWGDAWGLVEQLRARLGEDDPDVSRHAATLPARDAVAAQG